MSSLGPYEKPWPVGWSSQIIFASEFQEYALGSVVRSGSTRHGPFSESAAKILEPPPDNQSTSGSVPGCALRDSKYQKKKCVSTLLGSFTYPMSCLAVGSQNPDRDWTFFADPGKREAAKSRIASEHTATMASRTAFEPGRFSLARTNGVSSLSAIDGACVEIVVFACKLGNASETRETVERHEFVEIPRRSLALSG